MINNYGMGQIYMKSFFEKHETLISILLIVIYVISNSYCMQNFGMTDYRSSIWNFILSLIIIIFIIKNKLGDYYGLTKLPNFKEFLFFIPLLIIMSVNFWNGIHINNSMDEIIYYIFSMMCVGFLEEIIFRGFLFKMMEKENVNRAVLVTSLTFGIGHIVNLLNGASFIPTIMQICYATTLGFLFVTIFQKGKSLWPCIIAHSAINAFSIFNIENEASLYIVPIFLVFISMSYSMYLRKTINKNSI